MWKLFDFDLNVGVDWDKAEMLFPWFSEMKNVKQDARHHAEGNVLLHTRMVVEALLAMSEFRQLQEQEQHIVFAAAMMHDIGKSSTTVVEIDDLGERISSPGHAVAGEMILRKMLYKDLAAPFHVREQVAKLIRYHSLPIWAIERKDPRKSVIEASLEVNTQLLYLLAKADVLGRLTAEQDDFLFKIELFRELCVENECFGKPKEFKSDYGRFLYLNKPETSPEYQPFEDHKCTVFVMAGLPGSGKDTYIKKNLKVPVLSLDEIRRQHRILPTDRKKSGVVIQLAKDQAKDFLRKQISFVHNATNITREIRSRWISIFLDYGARIKIIYLEPTYQKLIIQNSNREHEVPEKVLEKMIDKLEIPAFSEAHEVEYIVDL